MMSKLVFSSVGIVLSISACDTINRPITGGDFDPLRPPGRGGDLSRSVVPAFAAGQFVQSSMDNTAFFKKRPVGDAEADKMLARGTSMKVISVNDSYVKVELDSGEVGFVPSVMVEDPTAVLSAPAVNPTEFQVYPPLDANGLPLPSVNPAEKPPEGAIPTVIDPEAPASGSAPLPPNGEETEGN
jgi:hypothetical protein